MANPVLKWAGGKGQLLEEVGARLPREFERYHEPFVGGGAVFFALEPAGATVNDRNPRLARFYGVVRDHPDALVAEARSHEHDEDYYYDARDEFNALRTVENPTTEQRVREASLLLYLNRTGFNGLYRENSDGEFNVPFGRYADPDWVQAERVRAASAALEGTTIRNEDFTYVRNCATSGDFVYCDPPYQPVSTTADFTEYDAEGFDRDDQRRLRNLAVDLHEAGVDVLISNSPPVAELYADTPFTVDTVGATRAINSDADNRGEVAEVLITNVPEERQRGSEAAELTA